MPGDRQSCNRDPTELRQFTAFVTWAAWVSVANRPGENHSYTNNFVRPRTLTEPAAKPLVKMFLFAAAAIPVFYVPALFFGATTHYAVVDTWRCWIIHLWVEGCC